MAVTGPTVQRLTKRELDEFKRRLAETTDMAERAKILQELSSRVAESRRVKIPA